MGHVPYGFIVLLSQKLGLFPLEDMIPFCVQLCVSVPVALHTVYAELGMFQVLGIKSYTSTDQYEPRTSCNYVHIILDSFAPNDLQSMPATIHNAGNSVLCALDAGSGGGSCRAPQSVKF